MKITVILANGERVIETLNKNTAVIGRSSTADVSVKDEALSRTHALIELDDGNFFVTDLGSSNGVYLNGNRIEPNVRTPFTTYITLTLGLLECNVEDSSELSMKKVTQVKPPPAKTPSAAASLPTVPARAISKAALNTPLVKKTVEDARVKKEKEKTPLGLIVAAGVVILALAYVGLTMFSGEI